MCGRFNQRTTHQQLAAAFGTLRVKGNVDLSSRHNIAPTQIVAAVRQGDAGRELAPMRWGLIPAWGDDPKIGARLINARAETVAQKPAFRTAFRRRRCVVPVNGYYEWQTVPGQKKPHHIHRGDELLALAGLWETWDGPNHETIESFTIITTTANRRLEFIHNRMPVILIGADVDAWVDPQAIPDRLQALLTPAPNDMLTADPIGPAIGNVRNQGPDLITPIGG